jgi:hypothetical protein
MFGEHSERAGAQRCKENGTSPTRPRVARGKNGPERRKAEGEGKAEGGRGKAEGGMRTGTRKKVLTENTEKNGVKEDYFVRATYYGCRELSLRLGSDLCVP